MTNDHIRLSRWRFLRAGWFWLLAAAVTVVAALSLAIMLYNRAMLERDVDHLFRTVLAGGNVAAAYEHADPRLRTSVPWPDFRAFVDRHPHWFDRKEMEGIEVLWKTHQGGLVVVMRTHVRGEPVDFYCRPGDRGDWKLVGIAPGLTAAVPQSLLPPRVR